MWSDRDTIDDCLGFTSYVETLKQVVLQKDIAPVTVGVFGDWGSGKTSLMRMLEHALNDGSSDAITVWFNPWQFEDKDEVQTALIHAILDVLGKQKSLTDDAKDVLRKLLESASVLKLAKYLTKTALTLTPDLGGLLDCFSDPANKLATTMREFNAEFTAFLASQKITRLVVFIDDLDRCDPQRALELFETIQLFLASDRCAFVIGADAEKIKTAVSVRYGSPGDDDSLNRDYLEKVIQVPFRIPYQSPVDVEVYIHTLIILPHISEDHRAEFRQHLLNARAAHEKIAPSASQWLSENQDKLVSPLAEIQSEVNLIIPHLNTIVRGLKGNPRQIKRFLNIYKLRTTLADTNRLEIDDAVLVKLLVMEYSWPRVFEVLAETFDPESEHSVALQELYKAYKGKQSGEETSKLIEEIVPTPGLKEFLLTEPQLDNVSLGPYLFLAQTSLEKHPGRPVSTAQEIVAEVVNGITSGDKVRVRVALIRAKELDTTSVEIAIAQCIPRIFDSDPNISTQTISGIDGLLSLAPSSIVSVIQALEGAKDIKHAGARIAIKALLTRHRSKCHDPEVESKIDALLEKIAPKRKKNSTLENSG